MSNYPKLPDAGKLFGMTEDEARAYCAFYAMPLRVVEVNGESLMVTMDYNLNRMNVSLVNGKVTGIKGQG